MTAGLNAATGEPGRPGVEVEPRETWPTGFAAVGAELKGRIAPGEQSFTGRTLGRLADGRANRLRPIPAAQAADGSPVLLIDDLPDSGWTLAVAARLPRRAAAEQVFPLVLAVQTGHEASGAA